MNEFVVAPDRLGLQAQKAENQGKSILSLLLIPQTLRPKALLQTIIQSLFGLYPLRGRHLNVPNQSGGFKGADHPAA